MPLFNREEWHNLICNKMIVDTKKEGFLISTDKAKIDVTAVHHFLSTLSYWSQNIPFDIVNKSIENSLCFGVFEENKQIGFARIITDYATFAYLCDVYILPEYRGKGLSKWLMEVIMNTAELKVLRSWLLATTSAHELYKKFGWDNVKNPERLMEIKTPNIYKNL